MRPTDQGRHQKYKRKNAGQDEDYPASAASIDLLHVFSYLSRSAQEEEDSADHQPKEH
jgi:hypothetical protein